MKYCDLRPAIEAYKKGENVMATLRELLGAAGNIDTIVEVAYDLQAGSYTEYVESNPDYWNSYSDELAAVLKDYVGPGISTLDVGTGEMTTLAGVAKRAFTGAGDMYACDISFSRIKAGRAFVSKVMAPEQAARLHPFVGNLFSLPFLDNSIDVIWTSHALEPNGGKELEALSELFRIAARHVVLFEPSYEKNSDEGRARMDRLGYIRDLPGAIAKAGGELLDVVPMKVVSNPLNPTHAFICKAPQRDAAKPASPWACPDTRMPMQARGDCFFSPASRLAYPIIAGIPVLRAEQAVLASSLE